MANLVRTSRLLALGLGLTLAPACDGPAGPSTDDFELPTPDTSLDPNRLTVGHYIATPCDLNPGAGMPPNGFADLRERHEWGLVDVFFGRESEDDLRDAPTSGDIELVQSHGGRVLYSFHVRAVRARIVLSRIPDLVADGHWITVRDVPDVTRYDVPLSVGFTGSLTDDDIELFRSLGGRVDYIWHFIDAIAGVLPDRSIATLRRRRDVKYIEVESVACLAWSVR